MASLDMLQLTSILDEQWVSFCKASRKPSGF